MATASSLLTAEEYLRVADDWDGPTELVRGEIAVMPPPTPRHGEVCSIANFLVRQYVDQRGLGRVTSNDAGVIVHRGPDTVRGADVAFWSYDRVPQEPLAKGYLPAVPELVLETLSPADRRPEVLEKVAEYLKAGVCAVCVLDPDRESIEVFTSNAPVRVVTRDGTLTLPEVFEDFAIPVQKFFA